MTEILLNTFEAFKLMLNGKKVVCNRNNIYSFYKDNGTIEIESNNKIIFITVEIFFSFSYPRFKEYIEPKKPRKFEFEAFIGENPNNKMIFDNSCTDQAFGYYTSHIQKNKLSLSDNYEIISKFKVTMEEILE